MLIARFFMSYALCSVVPDFSGPSTSAGLKRELDDPDNEMSDKHACTDTASENHPHESQIDAQENPSNQAQNSICPKTCGLCNFKHNVENVSQSESLKIHEFSLLQLTSLPYGFSELDEYFLFPRHPICASFKFLVYGKFHAILCNDGSFSPYNRACILIYLSVENIIWFIFMIRRVSDFLDPLDTTINGPIINIDGQPKYLSARLNRNSLNYLIDCALPPIVSFCIKNYSFVLESEDGYVAINDLEFIPLLTNKFESEFNSEMCREMLKNLFTFYMHVEDNM